MIDRILQIIKEKGISPWTIEKQTSSQITRMSARKIIEGVTKKPRAGTINILVDLLCDKYNVSRLWLIEGSGDIYMSKKEDCYLEKHGVRFSLNELIEHFLNNQETYLNESDSTRLAIIDNIVRNKDYYLKISEYFRLFMEVEIEKGVKKRLGILKDANEIIDTKIETLKEDIEKKIYIKYLEDTKDYLALDEKIEKLIDDLKKLQKETDNNKRTANNSTS